MHRAKGSLFSCEGLCHTVLITIDERKTPNRTSQEPEGPTVIRDIPHTYTAREAAERLGVGLTSLYAAVQRGELPSIRVGRRVLIPRRSLDVMLGAADAETREGRSR